MAGWLDTLDENKKEKASGWLSTLPTYSKPTAQSFREADVASVEDNAKAIKKANAPTGFERMVKPNLVSSRLGTFLPGLATGAAGTLEAVTGATEQAIKLPAQRKKGMFDDLQGQTGFERTLGSVTPATVAPEPTNIATKKLGEIGSVTDKYAQKQREQYTPKNYAEELLGNVIEAVPQTGLALATGGASLPLMGITAGGQSFRQAKEEGATSQQAFTSGTMAGIVETGLEAISFGRLEKAFKGEGATIARRAINVLGSGALEGLTEGLTDISQQIVDKSVYAKDRDISFKQSAESALVGVLMAVMLGGIGGAGRVSNKVMTKLQNGGKVTEADVQSIKSEVEENTGEEIDFNSILKDNFADLAEQNRQEFEGEKEPSNYAQQLLDKQQPNHAQELLDQAPVQPLEAETNVAVEGIPNQIGRLRDVGKKITDMIDVLNVDGTYTEHKKVQEEINNIFKALYGLDDTQFKKEVYKELSNEYHGSLAAYSNKEITESQLKQHSIDMEEQMAIALSKEELADNIKAKINDIKDSGEKPYIRIKNGGLAEVLKVEGQNVISTDSDVYNVSKVDDVIIRETSTEGLSGMDLLEQLMRETEQNAQNKLPQPKQPTLTPKVAPKVKPTVVEALQGDIEPVVAKAESKYLDKVEANDIVVGDKFYAFEKVATVDKIEDGNYYVHLGDDATDVRRFPKQSVEGLIAEHEDTIESLKYQENREQANQEREQQLAKLDEERQDMNGYANDKSLLQRGKILKVLNKAFRYDGEIKSRKTYIEEKVNEGSVIKQSNNGDYGVFSERGTYNKITKTEFDYANFLKETKPTIKPTIETKVAPKPTVMEATIGGKPASMVISTLESDIQQMIDDGEIDPTMLKKHQKALVELKQKKVTKATTNEFKKLVEVKDSIKQIKADHKEKLADQKQKQKDKDDKRKLSKKATATLAKQIKADHKEKLADQKQKQKDKDDKRKLSKKATATLAKLKKANNLMPEAQAIFDKLGLYDVDTKAKSISNKKVLELTELRNELAEQEELGVEIPDEVKDIVSRLDKKKIGDMTDVELDDLLDAVDEVLSVNKAIVKENNDVLKAKKEKGISAVKNATNYVANAEPPTTNPVIDMINPLLGRGQLNQKTNFLNLAGKEWDTGDVYQIFQMMRNAQEKEFRIHQDLHAIINESVGDFKKVVESKSWNKKEIFGNHEFTKGERLAIIAIAKDSDGMRHLEGVGYARQNKSRFTKITEAEVNALPIREGEQQIVDMITTLNNAAYKIANAEYMKRNGKPLKKKAGYYAHLVIHPSSLSKDMILKRESKVFKDVSSTKSRTRATKGLVLQDILVYANNIVNETSKYGAYVNDLKTFSDIMGDTEVRNAIKQKFGVNEKGESAMLVSVDNKIAAIQKKSEIKTDLSEKDFKKLQGNIIKSILTGRATTPLIQPGSFFLAGTVLSPKAMIGGVAGVPNFKEMIAENPSAYTRTFQAHDRDIMAAHHASGGSVVKFKDAIVNAGLAPIRAMDMLTVGFLWEGAKIDAGGVNAEARRLFREALDTQPNFTAMERADVMDSTGLMTRAITMFGSAKNAAYNTVVQGAMKAKQTGDPTLLYKALAGYTLSHLYIAGIRSGIAAVKGDEPEYWKKFLLSFFGGIPGVGSVVSMVQGYDLNSPIFDKANELVGAITRSAEMAKDFSGYTTNEIVDTGEKLADAILSLYSVGLHNYRESLELAINVATGATSKPSLVAKRVLDPYKITYPKEYYDDMVISLKKDKGIKNLYEEAENIGIKPENLANNIATKFRNGEITRETADRLIPMLPTIDKVDLGEKMEAKLDKYEYYDDIVEVLVNGSTTRIKSILKNKTKVSVSTNDIVDNVERAIKDGELTDEQATRLIPLISKASSVKLKDILK